MGCGQGERRQRWTTLMGKQAQCHLPRGSLVPERAGLGAQLPGPESPYGSPGLPFWGRWVDSYTRPDSGALPGETQVLESGALHPGAPSLGLLTLTVPLLATTLTLHHHDHGHHHRTIQCHHALDHPVAATILMTLTLTPAPVPESPLPLRSAPYSAAPMSSPLLSGRHAPHWHRQDHIPLPSPH